MGFAAAISTVGLGIFNTIQANEKADEREQQIEDFQQQTPLNAFENTRISTLGEEQISQADLSRQATSVNALQQAGAREVVAGLPRINEQSITTQNVIARSLDEKDARRSELIARGDMSIQNLIETREQNALLGLGQELQNQRVARQQGIENIVRGGLMATRADFGNTNQEGGNALLFERDNLGNPIDLSPTQLGFGQNQGFTDPLLASQINAPINPPVSNQLSSFTNPLVR